MQFKSISKANPQKKFILYTLIISITLFLNACKFDSSGGRSNADKQSIDQSLMIIIKENQLTGDHFSKRNTPDLTSDITQLGMHLFFSKSLSGESDSACVTCHHPLLGGGDNLSLSIGTDAYFHDLLGVGRQHSSAAINYDGGPTVPRNAPTTFNISGWDQVLFHDGRIESLGKTIDKNGDDHLGIRTPDSLFNVADPNAGNTLTMAQARFPLTSNEEMKGFLHQEKTNKEIRNFLAGRIGGYGEAANELANTTFWLDKFAVAFKQPNATAEQVITEQNIAFAIAQYEMSQVFVNNPWKYYVQGNKSAISDSAKRGALLFYNDIENDGANCVSCHSGDFFTDELFHNIAAPQIGRGKGNGESQYDDFGRQRETGNKKDKYAFRTPTLLNVAVTGPWMHTGAYTSLNASVKHCLSPQLGNESYNSSQLLQSGIQHLDMTASLGQMAINSDNFEAMDISLIDEQIDDLVAFLNTLTDPCVTDQQCMSDWIPKNNELQDPNGAQLNAIDKTGNYL